MAELEGVQPVPSPESPSPKRTSSEVRKARRSLSVLSSHSLRIKAPSKPIKTLLF